MKNEILAFKTVEDFLKAYKTNHSLAGIPMPVAATYFNITPSGVSAMQKAGKIDCIKIGRTKLVLISSILKLQADFEADAYLIEKKLIGFASKGKDKVFYEPIMTPIGRSTSVPADRSYIGRVLGHISSKSYDANGILLTVLVHRSTAGQTKPGKGFFDLARYLGFQVGNEDEFVLKETEKVLRHYAKA